MTAARRRPSPRRRRRADLRSDRGGQIFEALGLALVEVQDRYRGDAPADEVLPELVESLISLAYFASRDNMGMGPLAFLGMCQVIVEERRKGEED